MARHTVPLTEDAYPGSIHRVYPVSTTARLRENTGYLNTGFHCRAVIRKIPPIVARQTANVVHQSYTYYVRIRRVQLYRQLFIVKEWRDIRLLCPRYYMGEGK